MEQNTRAAADTVWVKPHLNRHGNLIKGYWRTRPKTVNVKGHFRNLDYIKPHKRRRPMAVSPVPVIIAGQPGPLEVVMLSLLRDVEPLVGY